MDLRKGGDRASVRPTCGTLRRIASLLLMASCASSQVDILVSERPARPVRTISISPLTGTFGDALELALRERGFEIRDRWQTQAVLGHTEVAQLEEAEILRRLRREGIDAYLIGLLEAEDHAYVIGPNLVAESVPISAEARVLSTQSGRTLAHVSWRNAPIGERTSVAYSMEKAAEELADGLLEAMTHPVAAGTLEE